jgi:uncharacterized protein (TIGR02145 family)
LRHNKPLLIGGVIALTVATVAVATALASGPSIKTVTVDGLSFKTVKIGEQVWMAENLNSMPSVGNSWCYDNDSENCEKYGRIYDWKAAMSACPTGWHLPVAEEWDELIEVVGGTELAGKALKSKQGWEYKGNGTDEFGFAALPGGLRSGDGAIWEFGGAGMSGYWWTSSGFIWGPSFSAMQQTIDTSNVIETYETDFRISVRCVKDYADSARNQWVEVMRQQYALKK